MRIYGVDFSSAPSQGRPVICAVGWLDGNRLTVNAVDRNIASLSAFEGFLRRPGPWFAGLDFPFGLPAEVVRALGWPVGWAEYVSLAGRLTTHEFLARLRAFLESRPLGGRHAYRRTDRIAQALAPTNIRGVPTARMFHSGAPILLRSGVSVVPCRPEAGDRTVVEAYPRLVVRALVGDRVQYKAAKGDEGRRRAAEARKTLLFLALGRELPARYGISLEVGPQVCRMCAEDDTGDTLDAVLCAVQAAWSVRQGGPNYGVPVWGDPNEGWIADPVTLAGT